MDKESIILDVMEFSNQAMLYELMTDPSFGLVSPFTSGSHTDMDAFTFIDSASVVNKYMLQFAKLGYSSISIEDMTDEAIQIGLACEQAMFSKTNGINTHKGLIFVLGTIVVATTKVIYDQVPFEKIFTYSSRLIKSKMNEFGGVHEKDEHHLSHGEKIYLKYQVEGVRKEAYLGFPIIQKALHVLDLNDKKTLVTTLMYIMSVCDDTTIIHRQGLSGLEYVKYTMNNLLEKGYGDEDLREIEDDFIQKRISPGGSADLLSGTIFLSLMKNKYFRGAK